MAEGTARTALGVTEGYTGTLPRDTQEEPGTLPRDTDKNGAVALPPTMHLEQWHHHLHCHLHYHYQPHCTLPRDTRALCRGIRIGAGYGHYWSSCTATSTALYRPAAPLPPPGATALNAYHHHCIVVFVKVVVIVVVVVTVIIFASKGSPCKPKAQFFKNC